MPAGSARLRRARAGAAPAGARVPWHGIHVELSMPGAHNAVNAAGALTAAALAGAEPDAGRGRASRLHRRSAAVRAARPRRSRGPGVRRLRAPSDRGRGGARGRATLAPARLVAVFQPHLFSRTQALWSAVRDALAAADVIVVLDVYPARERGDDFPGVDGRLIAEAAAEAAFGRTVAWLPGFDGARRFLGSTLRAGDLCVRDGRGRTRRAWPARSWITAPEPPRRRRGAAGRGIYAE